MVRLKKNAHPFCIRCALTVATPNQQIFVIVPYINAVGEIQHAGLWFAFFLKGLQWGHFSIFKKTKPSRSILVTMTLKLNIK